MTGRTPYKSPSFPFLLLSLFSSLFLPTPPGKTSPTTILFLVTECSSMSLTGRTGSTSKWVSVGRLRVHKGLQRPIFKHIESLFYGTGGPKTGSNFSWGPTDSHRFGVSPSPPDNPTLGDVHVEPFGWTGRHSDRTLETKWASTVPTPRISSGNSSTKSRLEVGPQVLSLTKLRESQGVCRDIHMIFSTYLTGLLD